MGCPAEAANWELLGWHPPEGLQAELWVEVTDAGFAAYARRDLDRDGVFVIDVGTHDRYVESPAQEAQ